MEPAAAHVCCIYLLIGFLIRVYVFSLEYTNMAIVISFMFSFRYNGEERGYGTSEFLQ